MNKLTKIMLMIFCHGMSFISVSAFSAGPTELQAASLQANPICVSLLAYPDSYVLGSGVSRESACFAATSGMLATQAIESATKQDLSLLGQAEAIAQQVLTVQNLVINTEQLIKDIEENPLQVVVPDINQIIANQKRIESLTNDIATNSSSIGDNLIKNLKTPDTIGLGQGSRFQLWSDARKHAIDESFSTVKEFTTDLKNENLTISQAIANLNGARGQRANARALSNATGQQLATLAKIQELLMKMASLSAAEAGSKLEGEISRQEITQQQMKGFARKPSQDIEDKGDIIVSEHPRFFGLKSVK